MFAVSTDGTTVDHGDLRLEIQDSRIDYGGARGSNTGDEFHELWAVRQALRILDVSSDLTAITVEGVPASDGSSSSWDGVDCTLLFGGEDLEGADRVELQQLKYSAANPNMRWTVARACRGRNGESRTSLIRRLADAFKALMEKREGKPPDSIKISLVTNQPVSPELVNIFEAAQNDVPSAFKRAWKTGDSDLHRIVHASGLSTAHFKRFATVMDFQDETGSRFAIEDEMLGTIVEWADTEFRESAIRLREYIRKRMLPEATGELITKEKVLLQFGVSDERVLFPCPSAIKSVELPVSRGASKTVVAAMSRGDQRICLHGASGVGKTTALQEIAKLLPGGSEMITFDCFGSGSYLDASKLRHRPRDAFVQLSNELAQRLRLPALLEPNTTRDFARAFRRRLGIAARALESVHPQGLLVITVDAADNSITAARSRTPPESSFVTELMSFDDLAANVRVIISARTGRLDELKLPSEFERIELLPFTQEETAENVKRYWKALQDWIEDFHYLSGGVPRVQAYAFEHAGEVRRDALAALQPAGKKLDQIFDEQFQLALQKSGRTDLIERVCAGLTVLPRPIPVSEFSHVLGLSNSQVIDICADLAPGVRNQAGFLSFSDEDFEAYVRDRGQSVTQDIQIAAADRFLTNAGSDEYAALNVAPLLFVAGRGEDLLDFVEREPEPSAEVIPDPVRRREIHDRRLLTAIRVCREAGEAARALRFVLIGAEAVGTSKALRSLLASFPKLTAKYAKETASRLILGDPDHVAEHGPLILHLIAEDATKGDAVGVREGRRRLHAWSEARHDDFEAQVQKHGHGTAWPVSPENAAASLFAAAVLDGADSAISRFSRFRPFRFAISAARAFVDRLLVEGRFELAEAIAENSPSWQAVFLLVPLARAGRKIDLDRLASGMAALKRRFSLDADTLGRHSEDGAIGPYVIDTVLSAAEILIGHGVHPDISMTILSPFLDSDLRRVDKRNDFEVPLLDAILRSYCLSEALDGKAVNTSDVLTARPKSEEETTRGAHRQYEDRHDSQLKGVITAITPVYAERARIIVGAGRGEHRNIDLEAVSSAFGHDTWRLDHSHSSSAIRAKLGEGLTDLVAAGANAREVMAYAFGFRRGFWPDGENGTSELCKRLAAIPHLHDDLLSKITEAVSATRLERIGAMDKARRLAAFAELLIPVSSDDADVVFQNAVDVASELDSEAMDQLRLLDGLIVHGQTAFSEDRRSYAAVAAEIVNDAAIRLQDVDHFPWDEAISSIAHLDVPTALASVARWDDSQVADLGTILPPVIAVGLRADYLNSAQAAALLSLHDRVPLELLKSVMAKAIEEGSTMASALAEEFAYDSLVDRIPWHDELEPLIVQHGQGEWTRQFREQLRFRRALRDEDAARTEDTSEPVNVGSAIIDAYDWDPVSLVDADKLLNDATDVLTRLREAGGYGSLGDVLKRASEAVPTGSRPRHLDALVGILAREQGSQIVDVILSAARAWIGQLAVAQWCKGTLPRLLAEQLPSFARYLPWEDIRLGPAMEMAALSGGGAQRVLLEGIERNVDKLNAGAIFALAGVIGSNLVPEDTADLCKWYLDRLLKRIPETDQELIAKKDFPDTAPGAVGRFLYAYMSDVDLRQRWRAAHALRRLTRLGEEAASAETVAQYDRVEERAFRAGNAPFYWLAARLWLVIALDRISEEAPQAVIPYGETLLGICFCDDFPHLLVRDYAADACRKLIDNGHLQPNIGQVAALEQVNKGLPPTDTSEPGPVGAFDFYRQDRDARRFHFDALDTLRYWYDRWPRVFEGLTPDAFLEAAEDWIVDKWGVADEAPYGSKEPRPQRFSNRSFGLSSNSHGQLPTLERYRNHLEWHAMWCAAGQLLKTHRLRVAEYDDYDELTYTISQGKLTNPPHWLSDFVGPVPLQPHRWRPPGEAMEDWLGGIEDTAFLRELFPVDRPGWVVARAYVETKSDNHEETVNLSTGLVSPATAHALVRALQTAENNMSFYICPEGHELEIDTSDYVLRGWLTHDDGDRRYDDKDPYRNGSGRLQGLPGTAVTDALGLEQRYCCGCAKWFREGADTPSFVYEAWGERERDHGQYRHFGGMIICSGHRLLVRKEDLAEFLHLEGRDLIVEIGITRNDQRESRTAYDTEDSKRAVFDRLFLLRRFGAVEAAERSFEAWRSDCS